MAGDALNLGSQGSPDRNIQRQKLEQWLNKSMRIKMTDGRTLVGIFLCTDCDCNIIVGSCEEYLRPPDSQPKEDPRILGLAMIPGKHIISIEIDDSPMSQEGSYDDSRGNDGYDNMMDLVDPDQQDIA